MNAGRTQALPVSVGAVDATARRRRTVRRLERSPGVIAAAGRDYRPLWMDLRAQPVGFDSDYEVDKRLVRSASDTAIDGRCQFS